jgi:NAD(P)-dependent dehydrogenase (short-subunit alcohol dehydrogenase family)
LKHLDATIERTPSRMTPLGRIGTLDELAAVARFLTSDEAFYVSGHTLQVAGERSAISACAHARRTGPSVGRR